MRDELDAMLGDAGSSTGGMATEGSAPSAPSEPEPETEVLTVDTVPITDVAEFTPRRILVLIPHQV